MEYSLSPDQVLRFCMPENVQAMISSRLETGNLGSSNKEPPKGARSQQLRRPLHLLLPLVVIEPLLVDLALWQ